MPNVLVRPGSISTFVLQDASLLHLLDLEDGTEGWTEKYSTGTCRELYEGSKTEWEFLNDITSPEDGREVRNYTADELLIIASKSNPVLVFDYASERPILLTSEWAEEKARPQGE